MCSIVYVIRIPTGTFMRKWEQNNLTALQEPHYYRKTGAVKRFSAPGEVQMPNQALVQEGVPATKQPLRVAGKPQNDPPATKQPLRVAGRPQNDPPATKQPLRVAGRHHFSFPATKTHFYVAGTSITGETQ